MTFDLPRDTDAFQRHADWNFTLSNDGREFDVSMQEIAGVPEEQELPFLKAALVRIMDWKEEAARMAADRYCDEFNRKWNPAVPITREEFMTRLRIGGISIEEDRSAALEFEDDRDMFWGHAIVVRFDREGKIRDVDLAG